MAKSPQSASTDDPTVGGSIAGRYLVRGVLGQGGQKIVYLVHDTALDRDCALSLIKTQMLEPNDALRLRREAQAVARLGPHPQVVTIYDLGEEDGRPFFVSEYLPGGDLRQLLRAASPLPPARAMALAQDICKALVFAHAHGVVHRDIKPHNVWLAQNGTAKLGDFGVALSVAGSRLTLPGAIVGTAAYLAPEQALGKTADAMSDLYSFGCLLYELVTGRPPFVADDPLTVVSQHIHATPVPPRQRNAAVPEDLDKLLLQLLKKAPLERPGSAEEILTELNRIERQLLKRSDGERLTSLPDRPETRYARSGEINIAYQVLGSGPIDLVFVPGWVTHLEYAWEEPSLARFYKRLASFARLILFDKRGTGLSDQTAELPTLEQRMDDVRAVMDAAGSSRAALFGSSDGGNMCMLFAATYPARTIALVTLNVFAKRVWDPDYPWAPTASEREKWIQTVQTGWGGVTDLPTLAPSVAGDERFRAWWAAYLRRGCSPGAAVALARMNTPIDVTSVLPAIRVPTIVFHRTGDRDVNVAEGRYIAQRIPDAKFVELPGNDHLFWIGDYEPMLTRVEEFLQHSRVEPDVDRVLATVLFAEAIAPSTATSLRPFAERELERFRGRLIESTPTAALAIFDGPGRAIRCACEISESARRSAIGVRIGLHTGEFDVTSGPVRSIAVDISRQVAAQASNGEVMVTSTVKDLVAGSGIAFQPQGSQFFEAIDVELRIFRVERPSDRTTTNVRKVS